MRDSGIQVEQKLFQWGFIPTIFSSPTASIESLTRMDSSPTSWASVYTCTPFQPSYVAFLGPMCC